MHSKDPSVSWAGARGLQIGGSPWSKIPFPSSVLTMGVAPRRVPPPSVQGPHPESPAKTTPLSLAGSAHPTHREKAVEARSQPSPTSTPLPAWSALPNSVHIAKSYFEVPALSSPPYLNPEYIACPMPTASRCPTLGSTSSQYTPGSLLQLRLGLPRPFTLSVLSGHQPPGKSDVRNPSSGPISRKSSLMPPIPNPQSPTHYLEP